MPAAKGELSAERGGADALSVARTVTTPIEQQINGTKGLIYYSSDSTSNGVSNIVATFDVGYSQDIAAVDIQNKVQTAQAQLPPEVKQYGVTIKKSSTDMVCVVNLTSPDGRYDSNFLDNYGQIYVADVLRRIETTLTTGALDKGARSALRDGRLDRELAPLGFDIFGGAAPTPRKEPATPPASAPATRGAKSIAAADRRAERAAARAERAEAARRRRDEARARIEKLREALGADLLEETP